MTKIEVGDVIIYKDEDYEVLEVIGKTINTKKLYSEGMDPVTRIFRKDDYPYIKILKTKVDA